MKAAHTHRDIKVYKIDRGQNYTQKRKKKKKERKKKYYMSIITMRSRRFPANSASDCLRFAKFRPQFSESCGATYIHIYEMFSALQSTSCLLTDFENMVQIYS